MSRRNNIIGYSRTSTNPLVNNLVAWYDFNNNALDALGVHNGTEVGSPSYVSGVIDNAINFQNDSTLRYVTVPDSDDFSFTNGVNDLPFSISMFVQNLAISATANYYICKRNANPNVEYIVTFTSNLINVSLYSSGISVVSINATSIINPFALNTWNQIGITYDGSGLATGIKIYVNGVDVTDTNTTVGIYVGMANTSSNLWFGNAEFGPIQQRKHRGYMDLLGIWKDRELTASDMVELYNSGAGKKYPF